jgi:hypothetical protein
VSLLAAVLGLAVEQARVVSVRAERVGSRQAVSVVTSAELGWVGVRREEGEVIVSLDAPAPDGLQLPGAVPPVEALSVGREGERVTLRIKVAPEVPFAVRREGARLTVMFGEEAAPRVERPPSGADVDQLYRGLFPHAGESVDLAEIAALGTADDGGADEPSDGLQVGAVNLRPSLAVSYVNGESALLASPEPVRDTYVQIEPRVMASLPIRSGQLSADYSPRVRRGSSFGQVEQASHLATASLEVPSATFDLRVSDRFAKGVLESYEVDPGGEYFFGLGPFTRNTLTGEARAGRGGRMGLHVGGEYTRVDVEPPSTFVDYESWAARGGLAYEATPALQVRLLYGYERIPGTQARPQAESRAHSASLDFVGEVLPLLEGHLSVGYEDQSSPAAAAGGTRFRGVTANVNLKKEFSPSTSLAIGAGRGTRVSAFEANAFYVSNLASLQLTAPLPLGIAASAGAGYHWNEYKTTASALGAAREDRIFGWSVGLGRPVTRHAYVRADYRRERRNSNVDELDITTDALVVQLGVGFFRAPERR